MKNIKKMLASICTVCFLTTSVVPFVQDNTLRVYAETNEKASQGESSKFQKGKVYHGFKVIEKNDAENRKGQIVLLKHEKTGAKVFALLNSDNNKYFSIAFRTPVNNNKGIPHIIEHCILLGGSNKYPVKQLINEAYKVYLTTEMNGTTDQDITSYPFGSYNDQVYDNLMDIYLSSVFNTRFLQDERIFKEEAGHYEINDPKEDIKYNGVVLNEMKEGVSIPEIKLNQCTNKSLLPDTGYIYNSGGKPSEMIDLTFKETKDYYNKYYSPSNSYTFLYGNINLMDKLKFINDNYFGKSHKILVDSRIKKQKLFKNEKEYKDVYSIGKDEDIKNKTFLRLNYALPIEDINIVNTLNLTIDYAFNKPLSPLVQKLNEKGFHTVYANINPFQCQPILSITASDTEENKKDEFIKIVNEGLQEIIKKGIDKKYVESILNKKRLYGKIEEADGSNWMTLTIDSKKIFSHMIYEKNPMESLNNKGFLENLEGALKSNYLESLLQKYIIDNKFSSVVILKPERGLQDKIENKEKEKLAAYKKSLSVKELNKLVKMNKELKIWEKEPNSKEALATIKPLKIEELKPKADKMSPIDFREEQRIKIMYHPCETNGISRVKLVFDTKGVRQEQLPYIALLTSLLGKVDTKNYSGEELGNKEDSYTTGFRKTLSVIKNVKDNSYTAKLYINSVLLTEDLNNVLNVMNEEMKYSKFDNKEQLKNLIGKFKNNSDQLLRIDPTESATEKVNSYLYESGKYSEVVSGSKYREFLKDINDNFDKKYDEIVKNLKEVSKTIFNKNNLIISLNMAEKDYDKVFKSNLNKLTDNLESEKITYNKYDFKTEKLNEGLTYGGSVQYNVQGFDYKKLGYKYSGKMNVIENILNKGYLWDKVRVQGGAYGSSVSIGNDGKVIISSYDDPKLKETYKTFNEIPKFLRELNMTEKEFDNYKITALNEYLKEIPDFAKEYITTEMYFEGITKEDEERKIKEILDCKLEDIKDYADMFEKGLKENYICTLGNKNTIKENEDLFKSIKPLE